MNLEQIQRLVLTRDRAVEALGALRDEVHALNDRSNPRNMLDLDSVLGYVRSALAAMDVIDKHLSRLHCEARPCDRIDGICLKCERRPIS